VTLYREKTTEKGDHAMSKREDRIDPHYISVLRQIAKMIGTGALLDIVRKLEMEERGRNAR